MPLGDPLGLGEALDLVTNLLVLVEHRALDKRTVVDEEDGVAGWLANQVFTGGVEDPVDCVLVVMTNYEEQARHLDK